MITVDPKFKIIKFDDEEIIVPNFRSEDLLGNNIYESLEVTEEDIINIHGELPNVDLVITEEDDDDDD